MIELRVQTTPAMQPEAVSFGNLPNNHFSSEQRQVKNTQPTLANENLLLGARVPDVSAVFVCRPSCFICAGSLAACRKESAKWMQLNAGSIWWGSKISICFALLCIVVRCSMVRLTLLLIGVTLTSTKLFTGSSNVWFPFGLLFGMLVTCWVRQGVRRLGGVEGRPEDAEMSPEPEMMEPMGWRNDGHPWFLILYSFYLFLYSYLELLWHIWAVWKTLVSYEFLCCAVPSW